MLVLVTNDDGIGAAGIEALVASLKKKNHDVWVVAPSENRSGVSHGISLTRPLAIAEQGERRFSCSGKPADCVIAATGGLLPALPDVVLSGINLGANLGTDVVFSGTAAGARQAAIHGIPGIAVSLVTETTDTGAESGAENPFPEGREPVCWDELADFVTLNLEALMKLCGEDVFLNINARAAGNYLGFKMTSLSRRLYHDTMRIGRISSVRRFFGGICRLFRQGAGKNPGMECVFEGGYINTLSKPDDDWEAVKAGLISVSAVSAQPLAVEVPQENPGFVLPGSRARAERLA